MQADVREAQAYNFFKTQDLQTEDEEEVQQEEEQSASQDSSYVPACLNKGTVKLCMHADVREAQAYKVFFKIKDMADSEIRYQLTEEKKKLEVYLTAESSFVQEIAFSKQRISILEDKVAKEDCNSVDTTAGATKTLSGRLQTMLGTHPTNAEQAQIDHVIAIPQYEGQTADRQVKIATAERRMTVGSGEGHR